MFGPLLKILGKIHIIIHVVFLLYIAYYSQQNLIILEIIKFMNIDFFNLESQSQYYMKDFNYFQNIKKNENFQIIINNYILKDYFIFNNINSIKFSLFNQEQ